MIRSYRSPESFRTALEPRIRDRAAALGTTFRREQTLVVFDRLLARIGHEFGDHAVLKGGLALEFRLARARTTRDIDLRMIGPSDDLLPRLQAAGRLDLGDFMQFEVVPDPEHPTIASAGVRYEGHRFRAACRIAGRGYGDPFGLDVAYGDPIVSPAPTSSPSSACRRRASASTPSRATSPRSCTRTPCLAARA